MLYFNKIQMDKRQKMNNFSFYGDSENKEKLISELTSKRIIKQVESQGNIAMNNKNIAKATTTLSTKSLDKSLNETIIEYNETYNIPSTFARIIEAIYQESNHPESIYLPEKIYNKIPIDKNLNYIWIEFNIESLINSKFGIINLTKNKKIIQLIEKIAIFYSNYKRSLIHFYDNEKIIEKNELTELKNVFFKNQEQIEKLPLSNISMMLFAINNSIMDETYIYDAYSGIYKPRQLTQEHYLFYIETIENIIKKTKAQPLFNY